MFGMNKENPTSRTHFSREEESERLRKIEEHARELQRRDEESKRVVEEQKSMTLKRREFELQRQALLAEEKAAAMKKSGINGRTSISTDAMAGASTCTSGTQTANFE